MRNLFGFIFLILCLQISIVADEFDFKDPKGVQSISFALNSKMEPLNGLGSGITGKVNFDGKDFKSLKGKISLDVKSIYLPNQMMVSKLMAKMWLNVAKNPSIDINFKSVESVKKISDSEANLKVKCEISIKGVKKVQIIDVHVAYHLDGMGNRIQKKKGDLLVLKSKFSILRSDFGIMKGKYLSVVANKIEIQANLVGSLFK
ncbi:MAG: hypothetical protein COA79_03405 [Planctomycetota bacterium]|nr:MAG: hypothetical protein COA79_03405 [Planctomycetota bacterium]